MYGGLAGLPQTPIITPRPEGPNVITVAALIPMETPHASTRGVRPRWCRARPEIIAGPGQILKVGAGTHHSKNSGRVCARYME